MNPTFVFISISNMVHSEAISEDESLVETVHALRYVFVLLNEGILDLCDRRSMNKPCSSFLPRVIFEVIDRPQLRKTCTSPQGPLRNINNNNKFICIAPYI